MDLPDQMIEEAYRHSHACMVLQVQDKHKGRAVGDRVWFEDEEGAKVPGVIRAFRCERGLTGRDAALIERTGDKFKPWVYVRALESVK